MYWQIWLAAGMPCAGQDVLITSRPRLLEPATGKPDSNKKVILMLYTIAVVLLILWLLGLVSSYTVGGFIHILLVVALVMILINVISGRRS
jgi:predicted ferric reductase